MTAQLAFDLPSPAALRREDFFVSPANALALATLEAGGWPLGKMLLIGPSGAGKTHLAHIWAAQSGAALMAGASLGSADIEARSRTPVAVEDAEAVAGDARAEAALFHLHNRLAERRLPLLLTAAAPPRDWGLRLPDLLSRMQGSAVTRIDAPDDALLSAVLIKQFTDRQVTVAPALIPFLVARMDRSLAAARALVARLDAAALARGGPVSRQLAAEVMDSL
ncbi:DnaA/Hda family protein [Gemmobacter fulvus]|uniref:DnaA ATPase domain-containing protein n=1 Tax=Gemmobacter fulvus TaxID=2840474 RepID=UPI002796D889|nr:DnaA/Hda family protein [Gemmobacter fulvus]MDQ1848437.1 DnaA/Hda family protein [Gemmobacter fulvus]